MACGFDFKLTLNTNYYCVEVKGLNLCSGNIMLTEKEFFVASNLKQRYCLFIVKNFSEKPYHEVYFNPLSSTLSFKRCERTIKQIDYTSEI